MIRETCISEFTNIQVLNHNILKYILEFDLYNNDMRSLGDLKLLNYRRDLDDLFSVLHILVGYSLSLCTKKWIIQPSQK